MRNQSTAIGLLLSLSFLTSSPVGATHDLPTPVAWWKLDELAGATTFLDETANNNDGTCTPPACPTMGVAGKFGTAADYDGADDKIVVPDAASLDVTRVTLSAWVNLDSIDVMGQREIDKAGSYILRIDGGGNVVFGTAGLTDNSVTYLSPDLPLMDWIHLAATYDGTAIRIFVNGVQRASDPSTGNIAVTANVVNLGNTGSGAQAIDGLFDDVRIYNQALTSSQIEDLFLDPAHHACSDQDAVNAQTGFLSNLMPLLILMFLLTVVAVRIPIPRLK